MREIKFRYWDMVNKEFITDGDVYFVAEDCILAGDFDNPPVVDITGTTLISQYTGLKDKNGTDIYEGDIVENRVGRRNEICWIEEELAWCARRNRKGKDSTLLLADLDAVAEIEVIGNIFEHRYLLEESK